VAPFQTATDTFRQFHAATDPLAVWLDTYTVEDPGLKTPKRDLIAAFNGHCQGINRPTMTEKTFGGALRKLRPKVSDGQRTVSGKVQWCYLGIGFQHDATAPNDHASSPDFPEAPDHSRVSRDSRDPPFLNLSHARKDQSVS
jgi:hypothetical protein